MDVYFITGVSKGIGFELARQLSEKGNVVIGVARTKPELTGGVFIKSNLAETEKLGNLLDVFFASVPESVTSYTLINNAGVVDPIGLVGTVDPSEMANAIAINLTAPMVLSNGFISRLKDFKGSKRIMSISSGAGRSEYEGWGTYCATKAGVDHFTRVIALEQSKEEYPVEIVSIAPGIIDTGMQERIRASDTKDFPLLERFIDFKEQGQLASAQKTAEKLINFMDVEEFSTVGAIVDIRDF